MGILDECVALQLGFHSSLSARESDVVSKSCVCAKGGGGKLRRKSRCLISLWGSYSKFLRQ
jgi:hypothetical protein